MKKEELLNGCKFRYKSNPKEVYVLKHGTQDIHAVYSNGNLLSHESLCTIRNITEKILLYEKIVFNKIFKGEIHLRELEKID